MVKPFFAHALHKVKKTIIVLCYRREKKNCELEGKTEYRVETVVRRERKAPRNVDRRPGSSETERH